MDSLVSFTPKFTVSQSPRDSVEQCQVSSWSMQSTFLLFYFQCYCFFADQVELNEVTQWAVLFSFSALTTIVEKIRLGTNLFRTNTKLFGSTVSTCVQDP